MQCNRLNPDSYIFEVESHFIPTFASESQCVFRCKKHETFRGNLNKQKGT